VFSADICQKSSAKFSEHLFYTGHPFPLNWSSGHLRSGGARNTRGFHVTPPSAVPGGRKGLPPPVLCRWATQRKKKSNTERQDEEAAWRGDDSDTKTQAENTTCQSQTKEITLWKMRRKCQRIP